VSVTHERDRVKKCVEHVNEILRLLLTIKLGNVSEDDKEGKRDEIINNEKDHKRDILMTHT
jgi:hypothetical protein